jgi:hypothetical protein
LEPSVDKTTSCAQHEEIKLFSKIRRLGVQVGGVRGGSAEAGMAEITGFEPCDLLDVFWGKLKAMRQAISDSLPGLRPIAALYSDMDEEGGVALIVRISISDVAYLHELRDKVLGGFFGQQCSEQLSKVMRVKLPHIQFEELKTVVDLTHFVSKY